MTAFHGIGYDDVGVRRTFFNSGGNDAQGVVGASDDDREGLGTFGEEGAPRLAS